MSMSKLFCGVRRASSPVRVELFSTVRLISLVLSVSSLFRCLLEHASLCSRHVILPNTLLLGSPCQFGMLVSGMELRHLRYFVAVAEEQSVTRAAARLHVSQPPLSRQIRDLEDEIGVALFDHGAKSVRLTETGKVFLNEARAVVERANEAVHLVKAVAGGKRGEIHVGYVSALSTEILPRALRLFQEANPYVRVQLHDMSMQEVLQGLSEEKLNIALVEQVPRKLMTGLTFEELHRDPVCLAAHPAHPLAHVRKVGLEQVARERLIGFAAANYPDYRDWLVGLFAPLKLAPQFAEEY